MSSISRRCERSRDGRPAGYTGRMKGCAAALIVCVLLSGGIHVAAAQAGTPAVTGIVASDSTPVRWSSWVARHGPVVLVVWASWLPRSDAALAQLGPLREACHTRGLSLAVADVSETFAHASAALRKVKISWIHDRHGSILKHYRLVRIPCLLILDRKGHLVATLDVSVTALERWEKR